MRLNVRVSWAAILVALATPLIMQAAAADGANASQVVEHHIQAFRQGNVDDLLRDYADDAVAVMPTGVFVGKKQLRRMFEFFVDTTKFPGRTSFEGTVESAGADVEIEKWTMFRGTAQEVSGADVLIVRNGKIVFHTLRPAPL